MNPLGMILKHHVDSYNGALAETQHPGLAMAMVQQTFDGDSNYIARHISEKHRIPLKLAQVLSKGASNTRRDIFEHEFAYNVLDGDYSIAHAGTSRALRDHPETKEVLRKLHISRSPILLTLSNFAEQINNYVNTRAFMEKFGLALNDTYWHLDKSLTENLNAQGLTPKKIYKLVVNLISELFEWPNFLKEVWTVKYLTNIVSPDDLMVFLHRPFDDDPKAKDIDLLEIFWRALKSKDLLSNQSEWNRGSVDQIKMFLYIATYKRWYDDQTLHYNERLQGNISVTHHEVVSECLSLMKFYSEDIQLSDHPKDIFKEPLSRLADFKVERLLSDNKKALQFPKLDKQHQLPDTWEHIQNSYRQIAEGQTMNHCCGGTTYINETHEGRNLFFHVDSGFPHGLTLQLRRENLNASGRFVFGISAFSMQYNGFSAEDFFDSFAFRVNGEITSWKVQQVKGRFNRNPTAEEKLNYKADLIALSLPEITCNKYGLDRFTIFTELTTETFNVNDPNAARYLSGAYRGGFEIVFHEVGSVVDFTEREELTALNLELRALGGKQGVFDCDVTDAPEGVMEVIKASIRRISTIDAEDLDGIDQVTDQLEYMRQASIRIHLDPDEPTPAQTTAALITQHATGNGRIYPHQQEMVERVIHRGPRAMVRGLPDHSLDRRDYGTLVTKEATTRKMITLSYYHPIYGNLTITDQCSEKLAGGLDLSGWDTSEVSTMDSLFSDSQAFNDSLTSWRHEVQFGGDGNPQVPLYGRGGPTARGGSTIRGELGHPKALSNVAKIDKFLTTPMLRSSGGGLLHHLIHDDTKKKDTVNTDVFANMLRPNFHRYGVVVELSTESGEVLKPDYRLETEAEDNGSNILDLRFSLH